MFLKVLFLISICTKFLFANVNVELSSEDIANAQTILVKFKADQNEPKIDRIYAAYEGVRYPFYRDKFSKGRSFYALVPTSYYSKVKQTKMVIVYIENGEKFYITYPVSIHEGDYKSEKLKVAPSRAKISLKNKRRIAKEQKEAMKIYHTNTQKLYIKHPLAYPMKSKITSAFGNKRLFNGMLKSYHSGTDFRAKKGTPIRAVGAGRVVLVKKRFFAGNSVIIDHGEGIYTGYYHMSHFKVHKGQLVHKGEILGLAGATGRVTGPHLHFSVRVNGVQVDPIQFLETFNLLVE